VSDSGTVSGIIPGSSGGAWSGWTGGGAWVSVRAVSWAAVIAQMARGGHDQHNVAADCGEQPCLALIKSEAVLAGLKVLFNWPSQPGGPDRPGLGHRLAFRHVAVASVIEKLEGTRST
jgi:hypothetical protein